MITRTQDAFIHLLRDYIHGVTSDWLTEKIITDDEIDLQQIVEYAKEQSLLGLVYVQLKHLNQLPKEVRNGFLSDVYLEKNREAELKAFVNRCPDIPLVLMKGIVVKNYYPISCTRSMGDVDLVIHTQDRDITHQAMLAEGYSKLDEDNDFVWTYENRNIAFEIHDHMIYEYLSNDVDYVEYFDNIWEHIHKVSDTKNLYEPDDEYHFIYLITHLAKHMINNGNGFRGFVDLAFICKVIGDSMDWKWIRAELQQLKLLEFTNTVFALCRRWFDVEMPLDECTLEENFYQKTTVKVFQDGIFGLDNEVNEAARLAKTMEHSQSSYWITTLKRIWGYIFPTYQHMRRISWYSFLDGRPFLLPIAWIYRWIYVIAHHKTQTGVKAMADPVVNKKSIEQRQHYINDWGL